MNTRNGVTPVARVRPPDEHSLVALLIAGEPAEAAIYGTKLRVDGYTVAVATSLERGLELAPTVRPDLIFVCLGTWAVPALVLLVLRSDCATHGVPVVLVSDLTRAQLASEVGGLRPTEQVVARSSGVHTQSARTADASRPSGCGQRPVWGRMPQAHR